MLNDYFSALKFLIVYTLAAGGLYAFLKKNGLDAKKGKKVETDYICATFLFLLFVASSFFFFDKTVFLECKTETMKCEYSSATPLHPELRPAGTYDISKVHFSSVKKNVRKYGKVLFSLLLHEGITESELPLMYRYHEAASDASKRFNHFLKEKNPVFTVHKREYTFPLYPRLVFGLLFLLFSVHMFKILFREMLFFMASNDRFDFGHKRRSNAGNEESSGEGNERMTKKTNENTDDN